jgi:hypothetical protein
MLHPVREITHFMNWPIVSVQFTKWADLYVICSWNGEFRERSVTYRVHYMFRRSDVKSLRSFLLFVLPCTRLRGHILPGVSAH